jgi:CHAT domain-containing protein/Tfp pilus assembly protein PilF
MREAGEKYVAAVTFWRSVADRDQEAQTVFKIGQVQAALGEFKNAIESFNRTLPLFKAEKDIIGEAAALNDMGSAYDDLGDWEKAIALFNEALLLFRQSQDKHGEGGALNNLAAVYRRIGDLDKALELFEQALPFPRSINDLQAVATVLGNIGDVYSDLHEYQKALEYYQQSLGPTRQVKDYRGEGYVLDSIGVLYSSLGDFQTALPYLEQSLAIRKRIGDRFGERKSLNDLGALYHRQRAFAKAIEYYNQGISLARSLPDPDGEANMLVNLGRAYNDQDDPSKAVSCFEQALELVKKTNSRTLEPHIWNNLAEAYLALREPAKAVESYTKALPMSQTFKNRPLEALIKLQLARLESDQGNLIEAFRKVEDSLAIVESLRTKIGSPELRSAYFATVQDHYKFFIELSMRLHQKFPSEGYDRKALEASERERARSLLEILVEANADIKKDVDAKLLVRERLLQQQLNARAQQQTQVLSRRQTSELASALAGQVEALTTELRQLETQIRQASPRYAALTQPQPLDLKGVQAQLNSDTLLLEYSLGRERSYVWAVSPTEIKSYELPARKEIETAARSFYELLNTPNLIYGRTTTQRQVGASTVSDLRQQEMSDATVQLSRMLLGPLAAQLGQKRLVIVADGALQYLPFAALPDPVSNRRSPDGTRPLIVQHEIVSLPSMSVLGTLRKEVAGRKPAQETLAVLADPVFYPDDGRVKRTSAQRPPDQQRASSAVADSVIARMQKVAQETRARRDGDRLIRLPGTRNEGEGILALIPANRARRAFDFEASRALVSSGELSQYRYVHFATHGLLDSIHPELSAIVLSLVDEKGNSQDGFLRAHEVYNLNLPAEVVVLSGCQTGLGKEIKGEGLIGLTRGFMYAGAARVAVSLWSVDDEATAQLMVSFYRGMLKEGKRPAEALRAAQIEMLKSQRWQAPYYWAAFVLQGEWK